MVDPYDTSSITSTALSGVGIGIVAGTAIRTMDMMERSLYGKRRTMLKSPRNTQMRMRFEKKVYNPWERQKKMSYHPSSVRRMKSLSIKTWKPLRW